MIYWFMKNIIIGPPVRAIFRPWSLGVANVPSSGPVIIASNHISFVDSVFIPLLMPRRMVFLAKSDYFRGRGLKGLLTRFFFVAIGMLPMDRSGGKASEASLNTGLEVLNEGGVLGIYPEGTRSPDGNLYRGRTGVARMVLEAGVPVIPVAVVDTNKVMRVGSNRPHVHRVGVIYGKPLDFSRYAGLEGDRFILRSVTDEITYEIARLGGQQYVDVYASSVRQKAAAVS
nr:MAG: phospholipid/glycerol acyltransferase [actinobacterium acMicro-1]